MATKITRNPPGAVMDDYQAQDDAGTLSKAQEIKSDPKRHGAAKKHAKAKAKKLMAVAGEGGKSKSKGQSVPPMFMSR